ncbi:hypothetical protein HI914_03058 [Erysiphe necator]|uniref:Uncharacterized protein n=1 Tax=Uncinula necator TaxID=52586 RepID=A0A0B1PFQ8_UNCNE|nr:hypothetical protein HI914_03058 [Erysiphe necator]KHJ36135.1 hypothetical protein EV44_g4704 [Erysiphe necator]
MVEVKSTQFVMDDPPPPYSAAPQKEEFRILPDIRSPKYERTQNHSHPNFAGSVNANNQSGHRFPKKFAIYHATGSAADFVITLHSDDPRILFYISGHAEASSQPSLILHSKPQASSPPLATANLHFFSETVAIKIYDNPSSVVKAQSAVTPNSNMIFVVQVPGRNQKEQFAWKSIKKRELGFFDSILNGMKLVNCQTGETLAMWTNATLSSKKVGKLSFLAEDRSKLGERFELMAVITLLSILERKKRKDGL